MTRNSVSTLLAVAQSTSAPGTELEAQGVLEIVGVNLDALQSFYEALGFRTERRTGHFAVVNGYGMRVFLAEDSNALIGRRWTNVRIVVPDVDLIWECVKALGLPIIHVVGDRPYGLRDFVVADPSGFEIRFAQVLKE
jgi:catechol 2,3-dioxygenase-like lactoylglutathione lyase family enzyme